jgi:hypothetical protein
MQTLWERKDAVGDRVWAWVEDHKRLSAMLALAGVIGFFGYNAYSRFAYMQTPDLAYDTRVAKPAYGSEGPRVLFDAGHWNLHKPTTTYLPFANLIRNDGYRVDVNREPFTPERLRPYQVLAISNALGVRGVAAQLANLVGFRRAVQWDLNAFADEERTAVREWVSAGGGLLLIADHAPAGSAAANLSREFGVEMTNWGVDDEKHSDPRSYSWLIFSRESGLLASHAVTNGRAEEERVNKVVAFTGQSLRGPEGSVAFLRLGEEAREYPFLTSKLSEGRKPLGNAQGIALRFGRGRVVVLGEAAMLSAQMFRAGGQEIRLGMEYPGCDNRQLGLNVMHWLSGLSE